MSLPRILLAPTHGTGLANALAAAIVELAAREERPVRYHHVGVLPPAASWDRWEGSSFLDPSLYGQDRLLELYERATAGAQLSLLSTNHGLLDYVDGDAWSPADVARMVDCPIVLVVDCRGWGAGIGALISGFNERLTEVNLAGLILTGVADVDHRQRLRDALEPADVPVVGCIYEGDGPGWDSPAPGAWGLPIEDDLVESVYRQVDVPGLEALAGQRGFLPGAARGGERETLGPLVLVAGGPGFTPWSRDSIEVLRAAGARVRRLDLVEDAALPEEAAGLVLAGHLWITELERVAQNFSLMRHIRVRISEGLPVLALGGGMLYLLRQLQDYRGRRFELAGVLPGEAELIAELEEPMYFSVEAERDTILLDAGEEVSGWVTADAEIIEAPVVRGQPLQVRAREGGSGRMEGAAAPRLLSSRVLFHLASAPLGTRRFVNLCAEAGSGGSYPDEGSSKM